MISLLRMSACGLLLAASLAGCSDEPAGGPPAPVSMTAEALGHYCQMYVADHAGPKAQIHLSGIDRPLWFSQVSDAVAYLHDTEREAGIAAVFVSDMAKAVSWSEPGRDNWIDADDAFFVIGSDQLGGMGLPDAIPFGSESAALDFVAREGGTVTRLDAIPERYVRPPQDLARDPEAVAQALPPN